MHISVGHRGDYAVRSAIDLARHHEGGRRKAREIAEAMDIPPGYLPQVLAPLVRGGLLLATAGPDGGYSLARDPDEITLLDVVEAAEGPLVSGRCLMTGDPCREGGTCPAHETWLRAQRSLADALGATTLAELVRIESTRAHAPSGRAAPGQRGEPGAQLTSRPPPGVARSEDEP